ncbi:hypothetical protein GCM10010512_39690 [Streptomyces thermoviolaceus subsp. thermoviolaceus]|nr:hypothetical protein GCM10010499_19370 [Streptomyces thermoviolaceus subsp. apingens]GHB04467.1 hypothetical protein GCM10010512_39690 [Streptomyces thermoviolaceus subsp. thermoviolaceus]
MDEGAATTVVTAWQEWGPGSAGRDLVLPAPVRHPGGTPVVPVVSLRGRLLPGHPRRTAERGGPLTARIGASASSVTLERHWRTASRGAAAPRLAMMQRTYDPDRFFGHPQDV